MKKLFAFFVFLALLNIANAQTPLAKWPELNNFHELIDGTYHPSIKGQMQPIKEKSGEMYKKARLLTKHKIPAQFDNAEVRKATEKLVTLCKNVNDLVVKKASDQEIKNELSKAHSAFHELLDIAKIEE